MWSRGFTAAALSGALVLVGAACTSTDESGPTTTEAASDPAPSSSSSYDSIAALHDGITGAGFTCTLEYPGLEDDVTSNEVSICTIEDETAYLTIWGDQDQLNAFATSSDGSSGTVALGTNWTVAVTTADLATRVADGLGGTAPDGS